ncbi:hypothetical protein FPZ43_03560 [Mucilaginibacter pallidiroseus]|uniref:Lipoprotein n=1 Tax=Mucilaginibacter pallidiroseus TaxID=2599295 RepID=A0A563UJL6_9SPHI|nr:hypothetical protein [Mucilaginibacter pallidiroseus]TWR31562.1 hypothetical protein FPZ43_03560 [Mucilaginibacter pallidiroseus]
MKKHIWILGIAASISLMACKGNGSTGASDEKPGSDTIDLNDGTGAPGSGTGSAGAGTVGDTTFTQQDTTNGAPAPKAPDTSSRR